MNTLEKIKKNHKEVFLPKIKKLEEESKKLGIEIDFSTEYESEYLNYKGFTYFVDKVENFIVSLYDETFDKIKKVPIDLILADLENQKALNL